MVAGYGSERTRRRGGSTRTPEQVIFVGGISNSEMPKYYIVFDIMVLPPLNEATSIAGLQAIATG